MFMLLRYILFYDASASNFFCEIGLAIYHYFLLSMIGNENSLMTNGIGIYKIKLRY